MADASGCALWNEEVEVMHFLHDHGDAMKAVGAGGGYFAFITIADANEIVKLVVGLATLVYIICKTVKEVKGLK